MKYAQFYRSLLPFWKREIIILSLGFLSTLLGLVNPYLAKLIIDKAYGNKDLKLFILLCAAGVIIFVLSGLFDNFSRYLNRYIKLRLNFDLNRKIFKKLQTFSYGFFQDSSTGEHLYKISYDIERVSCFIADILPQAMVLIPKSILILIILFYMNSKMALLALALTPFLYIVPYYFNKRLKKIFKAWVENSQEVFKKLQEVLSHIQLVKAFGKQRQEARGYVKSLVKNMRFNLGNTKIEVAGLFANSLANRVILGLILFYGGYQVIAEKMTFGSLSAMAIYLSQLSGMQGLLAQFFQQLTEGSVSYERIETVLGTPAIAVEENEAKEITFVKGSLEFRNVSFGYNKQLIFDHLSFTIEGGFFVGLAGLSGCGKTTLLNLILRLSKPSTGEILIDGRNINNIRSKSLYGQIGVALQEPYLWNDTIENNISYGKECASFEEIKEAARIACADEFIERLPKKYGTVIGENACKISEGQKQRIAIARALIKKPRILILDEALSSVDTITEARILERIGKLRDVTVIVVSHHHSTISNMHSVCVLKSPTDIRIMKDDEFMRHLQENHYKSFRLEN